MSHADRLNQIRRKLATHTDITRLPAKRLLFQLEFAIGLADLEGKKTWAKAIDAAMDDIEAALAKSTINLKTLTKNLEQSLAVIGKAAKKYTIHCVGHAHIDMNWMWSWPETVATTIDTFTTVLQLMEEFPDFCFTQSQISVYEIVRQHDPELFERIRQKVAEGRWEVAAPQWVEGDKNLASGESLAHHLLYSRQFVKEHFDKDPEDVPLDWEPDTFGHAWTIPSIIARGGVSRYYMCRGGSQKRPPVYWWKGPDGQKVLVYKEYTWYNDRLSPRTPLGLLGFCKETGLNEWMCVYGVGDHGGGPTRRDLRMLGEMNAWPLFPTLQFSTTDAFYLTLEKNGDKWITWETEQNVEFTGCYTSQSEIKKTNRLGELLCQRAEYAAATAWRATGRNYPHDMIRQSWIDTIFGHFHDILPGSGVAATRDFHLGQYQKTAAACGQVVTQSLRSLAKQVNTSFAGGGEEAHLEQDTGFGGGVGHNTGLGGLTAAGHVAGLNRPFVVFNPTAWDRNEVVQLTLWDTETPDQPCSYTARTPDGKTLPAQRVEEGQYWAHNYVRLAVSVTVPALGHTALVIENAGMEYDTSERFSPDYPAIHAKQTIDAPANNLAKRRAEAPNNTGQWAMENDLLGVDFDPDTGSIIRLLDKTTGLELTDPDQPPCLEYILERSNAMSSWVIGEAKQRLAPPTLHRFRWEAMGPYQASFRAEYKVMDSTAVVEYILKRHSPVLEIRIDVDWREQGSEALGIPSLRFRVPTVLADARATYETPYGSIARDEHAGEELPGLRWVDVAGKVGAKKAGLTLLNDCKYGFALTGQTLTASLLRSSYHPDPLPEMGRHEIRLGLAPHGGVTNPAECTRLGANFNDPLLPVGTDAHDGPLPSSAELLTCQNEDILVAGVKKADDEDALIVRLQNTTAKPAKATLRCNEAILGKVNAVSEVDLIERPMEKSTAEKTSGGKVTVSLPASGIASVKIAFA